MLANSIITYIHILAAFVIGASLVVELVLLKKQMSVKQVKLLAKADLFYGIGALVVLAMGVLKFIYYGKGAIYYMTNGIFILKISIFLVIGLLSIYPTVVFLKFRKSKEIEMTIPKYSIIKKLIFVELALFILLPFFAVLVSNGVG